MLGIPSSPLGRRAQLITDPTQRLLLACVLEDATESLRMWDCEECCSGHFPCPQHQAQPADVWPRYLELAGRLAVSRPFSDLPLGPGDVGLLAQAAHDALTERHMTGALNMALFAAYTIIAEQLPTRPVRR